MPDIFFVHQDETSLRSGSVAGTRGGGGGGRKKAKRDGKYEPTEPIRAGGIIVKYIMNVCGYAEMTPFHERTQQSL